MSRSPHRVPADLAMILAAAAFAVVAPVLLVAQETSRFVTTRGADTVAVEEVSRDSAELRGTIERGPANGARERVRYRGTMLEDGQMPLIEFSAWRASDPEESPARQVVRVIFKDDSVAVDEVSRWGGVDTRVWQTARGAVAYLNLSVGMLELATRRAARAHADSLEVPFFNLGGGETVTGTMRRFGADSTSLRIAAVEFRLRVDAEGRILGGSLPSQGLEVTRLPPR